MRLSVALICALCACTMASVIPGEKDSELLWKKQKLVLDVLQHTQQKNIYPAEYTKLAGEFQWKNYENKFGVNSKFLVQEIEKYWAQGLFNFKSFSSLDKEQVKVGIALYRVFFFAEDFETFQSVVWWARMNVNSGMFGYTFALAVIQRSDMVNVVLPASYEVYPFLYYGANVIDAARKYELHEYKDDHFEFNVTAKYTSSYFNDKKESKLAYYREDVGLNLFNFYTQMDTPFWMNFTEFERSKPRRGEIFLFQMQNLLARYTLERFSNGLGEIPHFTFYQPIATGYNSMLRYYNGIYFPVRNDFQSVYVGQNAYDIEAMKLMSQRIQDAIDLGFFQLPDGTHVDLTKPESIEILGNLIQQNPESIYPRYFKSLEKMAKKVLRGSEMNIPSVLEWSMTAMRDPMFYQMYQKLMRHYWSFKNHLPSYTDEELFYDNVKFESVDMTKLTTYFKQFEADLTNAVDMEVAPVTESIETAPLYNFGRRSLYKNHDLHIKSQQMRLNHDQFSFKVKVNAVKPAKVLIKMFLGPKYDKFGFEFGLNEMREHYFEIDEQVVDLKAGMNTFVRHSIDFPGYSQDRTTYFELYEKLMKKESLSWPLEKEYRGFPRSLLLPKGWKSGMPVQFFFYAMPYVPASMEKFNYNGFNFAFNKHQSFGFPLDRKIREYQWKLNPGNMYFYDTMIYHK